MVKPFGNLNEKEKLYIFDTTLRDGAQTQGVDFSIDDKEKISNSLDALEIGRASCRERV